MSRDELKNELEDVQVEEALRRFRSSVRAWSDAEYSRPRTVRQMGWSRFWMTMAKPAASWAMAVVVAGSIGVPAVVHHERQMAEAQRLAQQQREQEAAARMAQMQAANAISDEELLSHVDSDVSRETPEAMQPLASLMSDSGSAETGK